MFFVLDSNHFREYAHDTALTRTLRRRIEERNASVFSCIVAAEESLQGWISLIRRERAGARQIRAYSLLQQSIQTLAKLTILPFDDDAAALLLELQEMRLRVGTMDLKIAAICLAHDATLLPRNLADFERVPGLRTENWLTE
jgi:tRNA(fMet)-specific endonuclease VapC